ncbi:MAG: hypothetical protein ACKOC5_15515, partial [Chloroflexota bacterium]
MGLGLLLPLLLYLPGAGGFPYPSLEDQFSDMTITHYPYALYLQRAVWNGQGFLWSPAILSGGPFFANPLSGAAYPPGWAALLLPLPLGLNLLAAAHLVWGGLGLYRLLRAEGLGRPAALWGGLAFAALPKLAAHFGAGHLTLLYAVPWTPWLLYAARRSAPGRPGGGEALCLAMACLADPRWGALAGLVWLGWRLALDYERRSTLPPGWGRLRPLGRLLEQAALAGLLAAPLLLPLLELAQRSTRSQMSAADNLTFALPPGQLLGLLFPDLGGFHEYMLYPGQMALLLVVLGAAGGLGGRVKWRWAALAGLGLLLALEPAGPFYARLARLPLVDLLRVPSRWLFAVGLGLAAFSAHALDGLLRGEALRPAGRLSAAGLLAFSLALSGGVMLVSGTFAAPFA